MATITDLSNVQTKMFGVSLLGEENTTMLQHWNDRFAPSNSFFVAAKDTDTVEDIAKNILEIVRQANVRTTGGILMLALFLDLRKPLQRETLQKLMGLPKMLMELLYAGAVDINCFGYTGLIAFSPKQMIKDNILLFQEVANRNHKLWLVADDPLGSPEERWKPSILFLDFLRRHPNSGSLLATKHNEGSVGFMRYGEYRGDKREYYQAYIEKLQNWLEKNGSGAFSDRLAAKLADLRTAIREKFLIDANAQPLHPDMFPKGFFDIQKAKHNNDPFRNARTISQSAVMATGNSMTQQILAYAREKMGDARQCLLQLLEEGNVSITFVDNRQDMKTRILAPLEGVFEPNPVYLPYNAEGYTDPIAKYLTAVRDTAVAKAINEFLHNLEAASETLCAERIREKRAELSRTMEECRTKLSAMPKLSDFCQGSFVEGRDLISPVRANLSVSAGDTYRILMCRSAEDRNWIATNVDTVTIVNGNCLCYIDEHTGGIVHLDDAPVKCVFAAYYDCTDARLNDMLSLN